MPRSSLPTRRAFALAAGAAALAPGRAFAAIGAPETKKLRVGIPVAGTSFLPVYVAAERTWKDNGLDVELVSFRGDAEVAQALAGGSVDVSCQSLDGIINLIEAGQKVIAFFAGFYQADFAWAARPEIRSWSDLRGKLLGVSTYGSLTDQLTRYVLIKHGLDPVKDVKITQSGPAQSRMQALRSGRLDCSILSPPDKWVAEEAGLTMLGTQVGEVAPEWPKHAWAAPIDFINRNPNTLKALLRGHVQAIRHARADRDNAIAVLLKHIKFQPKYGDMAYREVIDGYNERGELPARSMSVYWKILLEGGTVKSVMPDERLIDDRFIKSFAEWSA